LELILELAVEKDWFAEETFFLAAFALFRYEETEKNRTLANITMIAMTITISSNVNPNLSL
jgi:hypothetical protein